jgi:hypothetical protein
MRRRTWVLVGTAAFVLVGGGVGVGVAAARYQPLLGSSFSLAPAGKEIQPDSAYSPDDRVMQYAYSDGEVITYGVTVHNSGSFTVRITSVETPPSWFHALLKPTGVRTDRPGHGLSYEDADTVAFQPFDLHPGDDRLLLVHLRVGDCQGFGPGVTETIDSVAVHFSFLGIDHRAEIPFGTGIQVVAPPADGCPGATHSATIPTP